MNPSLVTGVQYWRALGLEMTPDILELYTRLRTPTHDRGRLSQVPASEALATARYVVNVRRIWLRAVSEDVARGDYIAATRHAQLAVNTLG